MKMVECREYDSTEPVWFRCRIVGTGTEELTWCERARSQSKNTKLQSSQPVQTSDILASVLTDDAASISYYEDDAAKDHSGHRYAANVFDNESNDLSDTQSESEPIDRSTAARQTNWTARSTRTWSQMPRGELVSEAKARTTSMPTTSTPTIPYNQPIGRAIACPVC